MAAHLLFQDRQKRFAAEMQRAGFQTFALNPGPTLSYLTGLSFHLMERPVVVFFSPQEPPVIVLPELESAKLTSLSYPLRAYPYGEDPSRWPDAFRQAALAAGVEDGQVGVEPRRLRFLELRLLESVSGSARFVSGESVLAALRMKKDPVELDAMRKAVGIAQRALNAVLALVRPGISERDLASELTLQLYRNSSDAELPFPPIVSSGPNSANPHAAPTNRLIVPGDLLLIDWGASSDGYFSDLTRTFAIGAVEPRWQEIALVVKEANIASRAAVRPGISAGQVDRAARGVIEAAGYGQYFIHRTGHGLGLEAHEEPYIRSGEDLLLEPGMTFTIEPGIYIPNQNGVRIEDNVVVTEDGCETLSDLPRDLITIG